MQQSYEDQLGLSPEHRGGDATNFGVAISSLQIGDGPALSIPTTGVVLIVGGNNAGKSTLLRQLHQKLSELYMQPVFNPPLLVSLQLQKSGSIADAFAWMGTHVPIQPGSAGINPAFHRFGTQADKNAVEYVWNGGAPAGQLGQLGSILATLQSARDRFSATMPVGRRPDAALLPQSPLHVYEDDPSLFAELSNHAKLIFGQPLTLDPISGNVIIRFGEVDIDVPPVNAVTPEYKEAIISLHPIHEQGDGIASTLGTLVPLVAGQFPIALIDEPEAFLHPPQALKLGQALAKIAKDRRAQLILATHDRNIVTGALAESEVSVTIVRLIRSATRTVARQVKTEKLRAVWSNPVLRHSGVVDGLFHRAVVIAENERDCVFYAAALEYLEAEGRLSGGLLAADVQFVPSHGLGGVREIADVLNAASVPVVVAVDLDAVSDKTRLEAIVSSVGGNWTQDLNSFFDRATAEFRQPKPKATKGQVLASIATVLEVDSAGLYETKDKKAVAAALATNDPWRDVKLYGVKAFRADAASASAMLTHLDETGVVLAQVGELEGFASDLGVAKGPAWLPAALSADAHRSADAQKFLLRVAAAVVSAEGRISSN